MEAKPVILATDGHAGVREALREILRNAFETTHEIVVAPPEEILGLLEIHRVALVIMSIGPSIGGVNGWHLLRKIRETRPTSPAIILHTGFDLERREREALKALNAIYLPKTGNTSLLRQVIERTITATA